jgi:hypothetical protein
MKESQENNETKKQEKNKSENINIISQEDMINIKNINSDLNNELFGNNNNPNPQNKKNNFDQNESNVLNYNYLDSERINSEEEDIYNKSNINNYTNNKSIEEIINKLKEENKELKNDMKRLYFLTEENKNNLMEHIQILKSENYKLKNEKKNLEYKLLIIESKNAELILDKEKDDNENKIIQQRYLNEIKELHCQLNNYKIKLNNLKLNYDQLVNDVHYIQNDKI